mmetsp:Transcript_3308/g.7515  ORF Transcript_3308/g.7515 Transcript_3308/m.7515 type:complete len:243 (-) Transcript_3308:256-984(-)
MQCQTRPSLYSAIQPANPYASSSSHTAHIPLPDHCLPFPRCTRQGPHHPSTIHQNLILMPRSVCATHSAICRPYSSSHSISASNTCAAGNIRRRELSSLSDARRACAVNWTFSGVIVLSATRLCGMVLLTLFHPSYSMACARYSRASLPCSTPFARTFLGRALSASSTFCLKPYSLKSSFTLRASVDTSCRSALATNCRIHSLMRTRFTSVRLRSSAACASGGSASSRRADTRLQETRSPPT